MKPRYILKEGKPVMANDVVPASKSALPAHLQGKAKNVNWGEIDPKQRMLPRIKLLQATSPECADYPGQAKAGEFWHTTLTESLGTEILGVPIMRRQTYNLWAPRVPGDDRGILARARDFIHWDPPDGVFQVRFPMNPKTYTWKTARTVKELGLAEFGSSRDDDPESPPAATLTFEVLWFLPDFNTLALTLNTRSGVKAARQAVRDGRRQADEPLLPALQDLLRSEPRANRRNLLRLPLSRRRLHRRGALRGHRADVRRLEGRRLRVGRRGPGSRRRRRDARPSGPRSPTRRRRQPRRCPNAPGRHVPSHRRRHPILMSKTSVMDLARKIVRPLVAADEPAFANRLAKKHGFSHVTFEAAILAERARLDAFDEIGLSDDDPRRFGAEIVRPEKTVSLHLLIEKLGPLFKRIKDQSTRHLAALSKTELAMIASEGQRLLDGWASGDETVRRVRGHVVPPKRPTIEEGSDGISLHADQQQDTGSNS